MTAERHNGPAVEPIGANRPLTPLWFTGLSRGHGAQGQAELKAKERSATKRYILHHGQLPASLTTTRRVVCTTWAATLITMVRQVQGWPTRSTSGRSAESRTAASRLKAAV